MTRAFLVSDMGLGDAGVTALLGYVVVFFGLVLLMGVIAVFGKIMKAEKKPAPAAVATPAAPAHAPVATCEGCTLENVDEKTAALIMAIVADETSIPLNQLRFISIKEM